MSNTASLHDTALTAESALEQLATGLAQAGADPQAVKAVSTCASTVRQIVSVLGKGQEHSADNAPPAPQPSNQRPTLDSATHDLHSSVRAHAAAQGGAY